LDHIDLVESASFKAACIDGRAHYWLTQQSYKFPLLQRHGPYSKVEEKSSTTSSFSLSPGFLSFFREMFSPCLYGKFHKKEQNTFIFLFLRVFSIFSEKKKKKLHHSSHIRLIRRLINKKVWNSCQRNVFSFLLHLAIFPSGPLV
jgi:hypothetical protein